MSGREFVGWAVKSRGGLYLTRRDGVLVWQKRQAVHPWFAPSLLAKARAIGARAVRVVRRPRVCQPLSEAGCWGRVIRGQCRVELFSWRARCSSGTCAVSWPRLRRLFGRCRG